MVINQPLGGRKAKGRNCLDGIGGNDFFGILFSNCLRNESWLGRVNDLARGRSGHGSWEISRESLSAFGGHCLKEKKNVRAREEKEDEPFLQE